MITRDQAYDIIQELNELAHERSFDTWVKADQLLESDNEDDWDAAEELREEASAEQAKYFREEFHDLDEHIRSAVFHYVDTDEDFREEFVTWYGEDHYDRS
jgi:hypothetical protein